jgi:hypothetical protein
MSNKNIKQTHEEFMNELYLRNMDALKLIFITKYNGRHTAILIANQFGICKVSPNALLRGSIPTIQTAIDRHSYFINQIKILNPYVHGLEFITKFTSYLEHVILKDRYGKLSVSPKNIVKGYTPTIESAVNKTEYFINKAKVVHKDTYNYDKCEYINCDTKTLIGCKKHFYFYQTPDNHIQGNGCPICNSSKGEITILNYLTEMRVDYTREYGFNGCKDKNKLRFDFYIKSINTAIEYDGEYHYQDIFGKLNENKRRDNIKNKYCKDNNIKLIRIPYWEFDNIKNILASELYLKE